MRLRDPTSAIHTRVNYGRPRQRDLKTNTEQRSADGAVRAPSFRERARRGPARLDQRDDAKTAGAPRNTPSATRVTRPFFTCTSTRRYTVPTTEATT